MEITTHDKQNELQKILNGLKSCKVLFSEEHLTKWLFEYAIQTSEYESAEPTKLYLEKYMIKKAKDILRTMRDAYWQEDKERILIVCNEENLPEIVKFDHQKNE